jgi:virginiamycin A acetyltransferase
MFAALLKRLRRAPTLQQELTSTKLRADFRALEIDVGLYSYGCFDADRIGRRTKVGRYCSFADTARVYTRNHGVEFLGLTPYLYNVHLGVVDVDMIPHTPVSIADDVWVGHAAIILLSTGSIGRGAVIGAGSVVTKPVPAYAIVGGNPAKVIRMRFDQPTIDAIEETRWWERTPDDLRALVRDNPDLVFTPTKLLGRAS